MAYIVQHRMKKAIPILISIFVGAAICALSPLVTGELEPWDSSSFYLPTAIALASLLLGFLLPRSFAVSAFGLTMGQMLYIGVFLPTGPLVVYGFLMLAGYGVLLSLPFTFIASLTRIRPRWLGPSYSEQQDAEQDPALKSRE
jgi:hypothetical protein